MAHITGWPIYIYVVECVYNSSPFHANLDIQTYSSVITSPPFFFFFNIILFIYFSHRDALIYNVIFIYFFLFIPSLKMAASSFSEMYMLTGPGWSWRDHADGY